MPMRQQIPWQTITALILTAAMIMIFAGLLQKNGSGVRGFLTQLVGTTPQGSSSSTTLQQRLDAMDQLGGRGSTTRSALAPPTDLPGYSALGLRDPLRSFLPEDLEVPVAPTPPAPVKPQPIPTPPPAPTIQGVVVGSDTSNAIINGEVYKVGDVLSGSKILSIDRQSITIEYHGAPVVYPLGPSGKGTEPSRSSLAN